MIRRIGCRAHDYGRHILEELAVSMASDGYGTTQLALKKAILGVDDFDEVLTSGFAKTVQIGLNERSMDVSVLGAYLNYAHPDDGVRKEAIGILKRHLAIGADMNARCVGTETGSLDAGYGAHPDNHGEAAYERFKSAMVQVMPAAHDAGTFMAVEAVSHHIIHTPERMHRLISDIGDARLKVIFDINNLLTCDNWHSQEGMIHRMFDLLEDRIIAVHIKDFDFIDGDKVIVPIGTGKLALDTLMARVMDSPVQIDVLAENVPRAYLAESYRILAAYTGR